MDAASGLTRLTRQRAVVAAKTLLKVEDRYTADAAPREAAPEETTRGSVGAGIQSLASELVATSAANREALGELVAVEMDRVLSEAGYVRREEHDRLLRRVADLERRLAAFPSSVATAVSREAAPGQRDTRGDSGESGVPAPREPATEAEPAATGAADAESASPAMSGSERGKAEEPAPDQSTSTSESVPDAETDTGTPEESSGAADTDSATDADAPAGGSGGRARSGAKTTTKAAGRTRSTKSTAKKSSGKTGKSK
ncbi:hypothetical protein J4H86_25935 [Spiractinospora alimapuensis]|uniref:hypothetical protein n=1 Tax=Spiractinospora alimapuensis TaxID=2820884 RepID=UPI001F430476|nr:hypothetical protein [Spiractinospora alimapuensis]QVQ52111.1 hypothetical protein J4H86_25935 [Spiractinospora alimapuensis]